MKKPRQKEPEVPSVVVVKRGQVIDQRVVFVWADDWVATYIDGRKELEGHSINHHTLLNKLGIEYVSLPVDQKWLEEEAGCYFPDTLQECKIGND